MSSSAAASTTLSKDQIQRPCGGGVGDGLCGPQGFLATRLSADAQIVDDGTVALNVVAAHIIEQSAAAPDQHQQTATRMVILLVNLQVLGEVLDAMGEQADLNFRTSRVGVMQFVLLDQLFFVLRR